MPHANKLTSRIFVYKSSPLSTLPLVIPEYIWIIVNYLYRCLRRTNFATYCYVVMVYSVVLIGSISWWIRSNTYETVQQSDYRVRRRHNVNIIMKDMQDIKQSLLNIRCHGVWTLNNCLYLYLYELLMHRIHIYFFLVVQTLMRIHDARVK